MSLVENSQDTVADHDDSARKDECGRLRYDLDIENVIYDWPVSTVITEQIAELGCWDMAKGVIQIDEHNVEHTLHPGEIVHLRPGIGFAKKVRWKRG